MLANIASVREKRRLILGLQPLEKVEVIPFILAPLKVRSGTEGRCICSPILAPPHSSSVALGKSFITADFIDFFICKN